MMTGIEHDSAIYGGIEAGGTKWVCAIGSGPDDVITKTRFPTTTPTETLARAIAFFQDNQLPGSTAAVTNMPGDGHCATIGCTIIHC